ncbi:MAG: isoamylase early set domain-containing protein [Gemmatimonadetes bacterium]|nr:isoamylase early set domain-containing protein [Gemmatimonadota bacterium]
MIEERDELVDRAARALSAMSPVKAGAVARVLMAVRASKVRPQPAWKRSVRWLEDASVSARAAGMLVAASLVVGFVLRGTVDVAGYSTQALSETPVALQTISDAGAESRGVPVAMVFELANAKSVAVVGDFNGWDPAATPMQRVGEDGPWSATLLAKPGRHTYAFLVDGSTLVADPLAAKATSPDFGGDASVMMVRTP